MYENVRWLIWLKRTTIFLAWHPQIVKQVEKMYSYRWAIHRIKYFLSFSCNKRVFSIKKFRFHIYIFHWSHHWFRNTSTLEPWRISKYFVVFILWSILWDFLTAKILQHLRSTYAQVVSVNAFDILFFSICCLIRTQWNAHCNITLA